MTGRLWHERNKKYNVFFLLVWKTIHTYTFSVYLVFFIILHDAAGDVERIDGIVPGTSVKLVDYVFLPHLEFLELSFTPGDSFAVVRTKKPLDADAPMSVSLGKPISQKFHMYYKYSLF